MEAGRVLDVAFVIAALSAIPCSRAGPAEDYAVFKPLYDSLKPNMLGLWPLSSSFGLKDLSPNGIHGTVPDPSKLRYAAGPSGVEGSALFEIGSNNNTIIFDSPLIYSNQDWTWTVMVKMAEANTIMGYGSSGGTHSFMMSNSELGNNLTNPNKLRIDHTGGNNPGAAAACNFTLTEWQFLAMAFQSPMDQNNPPWYSAFFRSLCGNWNMNAWRAARGLGGYHFQTFFVGDRTPYKPIINGKYVACVTAHKKVLTSAEFAQVREMCVRLSGLACPSNCKPGTCVPDLDYSPGFACFCTEDRLAPHCSNKCFDNCARGGKCSRTSGLCICPDGSLQQTCIPSNRKSSNTEF